MRFVRSNRYFRVGGEICTAWLYLPDGVEKPPALVMAHGFSAERSFRLPAYAEKFAQAGIAVFVFDYRNFGESSGAPRNLVDPARHLEDWEAAIACVKDLPEVDGARLALWGSSFSGGHVIEMAARHPEIKALIAQVPYVGGVEITLSLPMKLQAALAVLKDKIKGAFGGAHMIPAVGGPGRFGCMMAEEAKEFLDLVPPDSNWENKVPARILTKLGAYEPRKVAENVRCPALIVLAEKDQITPPGLAREAADKMQKVAIASYDCGHFGVYQGALFEDVAARELDFLKQYLAV